jgi:hypothetical protein
MSARLHVGGAPRAVRQVAIMIAVAVLLGACGGGAEDRTGETTTRPRTHATAPPPAPTRTMTRDAALRALRRHRVAVDERTVALDPATLTCVGIGPGRKRGGRMTWSRFRCVQPTFPPGVTVGPDIVFYAEAAPSGRGIRVSGARLTAY